MYFSSWGPVVPNIIMSKPYRTAIAIILTVFLAGCTTSSTLQSSPYAIPNKRYAAIVIEAKTGRVLHQYRADAIRYPASLTKMMTMYLAFEALQQGRISKLTRIPVSAAAARQSPSKLYLKSGTTISVESALQALSVKSANDVAYAMAEFLGDSEAGFARKMTAKARLLGMKSTTFRNASGLPDKKQVSTARDMARLGIALHKRFPQHFHYFSKRTMIHGGKTIRGHNKVLGMLRGANGIKTGYTRASGFNLVTSARTKRGIVIGVILGENTGRSRDRHMVELFKRYAN